MSATVIDAFLMTLGLDTKGLKAGQKDAEASMKQVERQAVETAQAVKEQGSVAGEFYSGLIEKAAAFFAFIAGGMELKEFVKGTVEAEVETQHLSDLIGLSGVEIQKWRGALVLADGKAGEFDSSIKHLSGSLVDIAKSLPKSERAIRSINAALGEGYIQKGQKKDLLAVLDDLSKKAATMDIQTGTRLMERIFGERSEAMTRLLRKGPEGILEAKKKAESFGLFSEEDIKASAELKASWNDLGLAGSGLARGTIMGLVTPALQSASIWLVRIAEWAHKNPEIMRVAFVSIAAAVSAASVAVVALTVSLSPLMLEMAGVSLAIGALAGGAYEIYTEWDKWLPQLDGMLPGSHGTIAAAKKGMDELGTMWRNFLAGNDAEADKAATKVTDAWMNALVHFSSQLDWFILDIPYKIVRTFEQFFSKKDWTKIAEGFGLTSPGASPGATPGTKAHQQELHAERLRAAQTITQPEYAEHAQPKAWTLGWAFNMFDTRTQPAESASPITTVHVDNINITSDTNDPQAHAEQVADHLMHIMSSHIVEHAKEGQH